MVHLPSPCGQRSTKGGSSGMFWRGPNDALRSAKLFKEVDSVHTSNALDIMLKLSIVWRGQSVVSEPSGRGHGPVAPPPGSTLAL